MLKLSKQQREILMNVYAEPLGYRQNPHQPGIPWQSGEESRSKQASISRSLHRLEDRGLVIRSNHISGSPGMMGVRTKLEEPAPVRTDYVMLTEQGTDVAEQLFDVHLNG